MKISMRSHKQDYFIILLAGILVIIVFAIVYITFTQSPNSSQTTTHVSNPTPTAKAPDNLPVVYDYAAEDRLAKKIKARPTLPPTDTQAKNTTLNTILKGFNSGVLYETDDVRLEYVQTADLFMGEIKTTNIAQAKSETNIWFTKQGFSQEGICNLPLMFYLDPLVSQSLIGQDVIFSPLPNGC